jgi:2-keto-4-pentenoate hydratase/2-oxohepta-3-ene-1,7-dioic acid hydratase in catechol pathway
VKLLRYGPAGSERPGVLLDDGRLLDVSAEVDDYGPAFFAGEGVDRVRELIASRGSGLPTVEVDDVRLGPPIARPHKLMCVGLNYADHAAESGQPVPAEPIVFSKATNTIVGPDDEVLLPRGSVKSDWEVELAVVLGATARYLPDEAAAMRTIAGYCISNDVSEREFQLERGGQWVKGKSCETFNPLGPWLVTADEVGDPQRLDLSLALNGTTVQSGNTETMIFDVAHLVWYLSQFMVLEPGDLLNTGTPPGVGMGMEPQRFLQEGDVMELEVAGLGRQRQVCGRA